MSLYCVYVLECTISASWWLVRARRAALRRTSGYEWLTASARAQFNGLSRKYVVYVHCIVVLL